MANIIRWGLTDGFRLAQTVGKELRDPQRYTPQEFFAAAQSALKKHPNEWVIYYSLADKYQTAGYYVEGLKATRKCVEIRPNDIRSIYALATSYNLITRAAWSDKEDEAAKLLQIFFGNKENVDKRLSQAAIDRTGLAIETAAVQAIRWFEKALTLNPDGQSQAQIQWDLKTLYERFPHLKQQLLQEEAMNKLKICFLFVAGVLFLASCIVDSSWLGLVGRWKDIENPSFELEFTGGGQFREYLFGEIIGYGEFYAEGNNITLHYSSECGEENQVSCDVTLKFDVTDETLIITDRQGDIRFSKENDSK